MLGRVVNLKALPDAMRFLWGKGFIESCYPVSRELLSCE